MLEARLNSDSYAVPGFGGYGIDSPVTTIYDPSPDFVPGIREFDFPSRLPGAIVDGQAMYCGPADEFFPMPGAATGIDYGNLTGLGGDVHDTFKNDRYGNVYGGHTTFQLPGGIKENFDW